MHSQYSPHHVMTAYAAECVICCLGHKLAHNLAQNLAHKLAQNLAQLGLHNPPG